MIIMLFQITIKMNMIQKKVEEYVNWIYENGIAPVYK